MRKQPRAPLHITCARYGTIPNHGEHPCSGKQRRCRCGPKVRPYERLCNTISSQQRQMAVPTISRLWRYLFSMARRRQPARNTGADHGCASPDHNTKRSPSRSNAELQLTHSELTISMPHRLCLLGKFSDVARANRLEADLPEVNLPLWIFCEEGAVSSDGRKAPARSTHLCGGSERSHGIEAVPEWR